MVKNLNLYKPIKQKGFNIRKSYKLAYYNDYSMKQLPILVKIPSYSN